MNFAIEQLIQEAKHRMAGSADPAHDLAHATQVANYAQNLCVDSGLNIEQKSAVILAAWWHDVGRTVTKKPSFVWMPFFDDLISGIMLLFATAKGGYFGTGAGTAARIILCKSLGGGALLTKVLVRKKNRIMINILKDADALEVLNFERLQKLMPLVEQHIKYKLGYKAMIHWFLKSNQLKMKTQAARIYVVRMLRAFLQWVKKSSIFAWHVLYFGKSWSTEMIRKGEKLLTKTERRYTAGGLVASR